MKCVSTILLFTEVELDKNRTWCPRAGCETVCLVGPLEKSEINTLVAVTSPHAVQCPTCMDEFCSSCKKAVSRGTHIYCNMMSIVDFLVYFFSGTKLLPVMRI